MKDPEEMNAKEFRRLAFIVDGTYLTYTLIVILLTYYVHPLAGLTFSIILLLVAEMFWGPMDKEE